MASNDADTRFAMRLIAQFLGALPQRVRELCEAAERADFEALERYAHSLKSSATYVDASELSACCRQIERLGRAHSRAELAPLLQRLEQAQPLEERRLQLIREHLATRYPDV